MPIRHVFKAILIVLMCTSFSYGWQNQSPETPPGNAHPAPTPPGAPVQQYQNVPQYGGAQQPAPQYEPPQPANMAQDPYPQYPYPQYHNPYYSGNRMTARDMLTYTMDWLFSLPSNVADHVSNFVDNRFFPRTPATHGGQPQSQIQETVPPAGNSALQQMAPAPGTAPADAR